MSFSTWTIDYISSYNWSLKNSPIQGCARGYGNTVKSDFLVKKNLATLNISAEKVKRLPTDLCFKFF